mmetsp:Transcript_33555/g.76726  ORF Transcript_33555/g.76726 Transcript_33555/m.76726 type:complete len:1120 (-) Transcript_33555:897-4256(-)
MEVKDFALELRVVVPGHSASAALSSKVLGLHVGVDWHSWFGVLVQSTGTMNLNQNVKLAACAAHGVDLLLPLPQEVQRQSPLSLCLRDFLLRLFLWLWRCFRCGCRCRCGGGLCCCCCCLCTRARLCVELSLAPCLGVDFGSERIEVSPATVGSLGWLLDHTEVRPAVCLLLLLLGGGRGGSRRSLLLLELSLRLDLPLLLLRKSSTAGRLLLAQQTLLFELCCCRRRRCLPSLLLLGSPRLRLLGLLQRPRLGLLSKPLVLLGLQLGRSERGSLGLPRLLSGRRSGFLLLLLAELRSAALGAGRLLGLLLGLALGYELGKLGLVSRLTLGVSRRSTLGLGGSLCLRQLLCCGCGTRCGLFRLLCRGCGLLGCDLRALGCGGDGGPGGGDLRDVGAVGEGGEETVALRIGITSLARCNADEADAPPHCEQHLGTRRRRLGGRGGGSPGLGGGAVLGSLCCRGRCGLGSGSSSLGGSTRILLEVGLSLGSSSSLLGSSGGVGGSLGLHRRLVPCSPRGSLLLPLLLLLGRLGLRDRLGLGPLQCRCSVIHGRCGSFDGGFRRRDGRGGRGTVLGSDCSRGLISLDSGTSGESLCLAGGHLARGGVLVHLCGNRLHCGDDLVDLLGVCHAVGRVALHSAPHRRLLSASSRSRRLLRQLPRLRRTRLRLGLGLRARARLVRLLLRLGRGGRGLLLRLRLGQLELQRFLPRQHRLLLEALALRGVGGLLLEPLLLCRGADGIGRLGCRFARGFGGLGGVLGGHGGRLDRGHTRGPGGAGLLAVSLSVRREQGNRCGCLLDSARGTRGSSASSIGELQGLRCPSSCRLAQSFGSLRGNRVVLRLLREHLCARRRSCCLAHGLGRRGGKLGCGRHGRCELLPCLFERSRLGSLRVGFGLEPGRFRCGSSSRSRRLLVRLLLRFLCGSLSRGPFLRLPAFGRRLLLRFELLQPLALLLRPLALSSSKRFVFLLLRRQRSSCCFCLSLDSRTGNFRHLLICPCLCRSKSRLLLSLLALPLGALRRDLRLLLLPQCRSLRLLRRHRCHLDGCRFLLLGELGRLLLCEELAGRFLFGFQFRDSFLFGAEAGRAGLLSGPALGLLLSEFLVQRLLLLCLEMFEPTHDVLV